MLAHWRISQITVWALLHLLQPVAGLGARRELRGRWPWAAMLACIAASVVPVGLFALVVVVEIAPGGRALTASAWWSDLAQGLLLAVKWFAFPVAMIGVALDPAFFRRPWSFFCRLAGAVAAGYAIYLANRG